MANRHGLTRDIPAAVKRAVRQRCGFGCIFDGSLIYEYDHFRPEYADATEHLADGITLLCPNHHSEKTKGLITADMVESADAGPFARRQGFASRIQMLQPQPISVSIGQFQTINVPKIIHVDGLDVLRIRPPLDTGEPYRLSAKLFDWHGRSMVKIVDNELRASSGSADVTQVANRTEIRDANGEIVLRLVFAPPAELSITHLRFRYRNFGMDHHPDRPSRIFTPIGVQEIQNLTYSNGQVGICYGLSGLQFGMGGGELSIGTMRGA